MGRLLFSQPYHACLPNLTLQYVVQLTLVQITINSDELGELCSCSPERTYGLYLAKRLYLFSYKMFERCQEGERECCLVIFYLPSPKIIYYATLHGPART